MKGKFRIIRALTVLALSLLSLGILFGCGGETVTVQPPEVKDVTVTADEGAYGVAGAPHRVNYSVPEGCNVTTSVQLGDRAATAADYVCRDGEYVFYTAGEYTVTVYAAKDGLLGSASATVTIQSVGAFVRELGLYAATGETYGTSGALHVLTYSVPAGSTVAVSFQKDGEATDEVTYDRAAGTVVFGTAGTYTVTVTASCNGTEASEHVDVEVVAAEAFAAPEVAFALDADTAEEDETVIISRSAVYDIGDVAASEEISVLYRTGEEEYAEADEALYTVNGDLFTPHAAGDWKLVFCATGRGGTSAEASAELTCTPAPVELAPVSTGLLRIQTERPAEFDYLVTGAADKYDVTFDTHGNEGVTAEAGNGYSVRITAGEVDCFTVTVVYTHKVDASIRKTVDFNVYSVESLAYAPVWGEDPFGGMPDEVLSSMGHLLYFDATAYDGTSDSLGYDDIQYEVIENNVTASRGSREVEILFAAGDRNYPYVIVSNFDNNVAEGNFTLKATLTDGRTGYSAVATKTFRVIPTTNDNSRARTVIRTYVWEHSRFYDVGSMDLGNVSSDSRQNMVLTRTGVIIQRTNPSWALQDDKAQDRTQNSDFAYMEYDSPAADCRLEFKFTLLGPNPASNVTWLGIGLRTGNADGWVGFLDLHSVSGKLAVTNGIGGNATMSSVTMSAAEAGATLWVRIDRHVVGSQAEYTVLVKTADDGAYVECLKCTFPVNTNAGTGGAPVAQYQFTHRNGGGCYAVDYVSVSTL